MCDRCFEKQCGLLDGAPDRQPPKLYVVLPVPTQVAQFPPVISPTLAFRHLQEALQACAGTQPSQVFVQCLLTAASFANTTHLNWVAKVEDC